MPQRPVVLVTGGARRLGREIALELAAHGWDIALHYRTSAADAALTLRLLRERGAAAEGFAADLADEAACRALLPQVLQRFGRLRAVVNNASLFEHDDVHGFSAALMDRHWRANVAPAVLLAQALHAQCTASGETGCVVNLLDQKLWNPNPDYLSYTLSKAALQMATTLLAQALAPRVRVCGVAPGVTLPSGPMDAPAFAQAHRMTPLQRSSTAADVAGAVRYLLDAAAVTGSTLLVDGGQHLAHQSRDVMFLTPEPR
jgi:NAD(P)-dependent dehydrogenase (short-subunit alcohol dehydrogenase family)